LLLPLVLLPPVAPHPGDFSRAQLLVEESPALQLLLLVMFLVLFLVLFQPLL
jgi:hypothetical protein